MCFYYGYLNFILGMKLPKYNLCYNTRDLIKSLAENTNDRNELINYSIIDSSHLTHPFHELNKGRMVMKCSAHFELPSKLLLTDQLQ